MAAQLGLHWAGVEIPHLLQGWLCWEGAEWHPNEVVGFISPRWPSGL